jgi:KDO2-lipid IV(A) lauroyltransferase
MMAYIAYYLVVLPLSYLPLRILYAVTDIFYVLLITIIPYRKKVITRNLQNSFPEKSKSEINQIRNKFYRHFCDLLAEGVKNLTISQRELTKRFQVVNPEIMTKLFEANKSVVLVSGHYNNWEWLITAQNFLFPHHAIGIGMPMTNKFWDKKINQHRMRFGMKVVHAKNFRKELSVNPPVPLAILALSDQSPGDSRKSFWMEFLNQPTAVLFGAEQIAHEWNYAVVFFSIKKVKRGHYALTLQHITTSPESTEWGEITSKHTNLLEHEIRKNPEYWIWSHKRWKRTVPSDLETLKKQQHEKFNLRFKTKQPQ